MVTLDAEPVLPPPTAKSASESVWWQIPTPFSVVGTRRTYIPIAHRKCYFVQWASNIYTSVLFGRVGGVSNVFVLFHYLLWKAKLNLTALSEDLDSWSINVSFSTGSIASCGVMKTPSCIIRAVDPGSSVGTS